MYESTLTYRRSSWTGLPKTLHLASLPILILLSMAILHSESPSIVLAETCLCVAAVNVAFIYWDPMSQPANLLLGHHQTERDLSTPRLDLAIALLRASLYAVIADSTVALLLINAPSPSSSTQPVGFGFDEWAQIGLSAVMWLLGAALWITEPILFWLDSRSRSKGARREVLLGGGYEALPSYDSEEDTIIVWEEDPSHPSFAQMMDKE